MDSEVEEVEEVDNDQRAAAGGKVFSVVTPWDSSVTERYRVSSLDLELHTSSGMPFNISELWPSREGVDTFITTLFKGYPSQTLSSRLKGRFMKGTPVDSTGTSTPCLHLSEEEARTIALDAVAAVFCENVHSQLPPRSINGHLENFYEAHDRVQAAFDAIDEPDPTDEEPTFVRADSQNMGINSIRKDRWWEVVLGMLSDKARSSGGPHA
jgi:hypothetical protein